MIGASRLVPEYLPAFSREPLNAIPPNARNSDQLANDHSINEHAAAIPLIDRHAAQ